MAAPFPLMMLRPGDCGRIHGVRGGRCTCRRLTDMGLCPNAQVEVMEEGHGSLIVKVNGSRYALGRGMAARIMVSEDVCREE